MKKSNILFLLILSIIIFSCVTDPPNINTDSDLIKINNFSVSEVIIKDTTNVFCDFVLQSGTEAEIKFLPTKGIMVDEPKFDSASTNSSSKKVKQKYQATEDAKGIIKIKVEIKLQGYTKIDSLFISVQDDPTIPSQPINPYPITGTTNIPVYQKLKWKSFIKKGSVVKYDLYLGDNENPLLYLSNLTKDSIMVSNLKYNQKYYWKIVAKYDDAKKTESEMWNFSTRELIVENLENVKFIEISSGDYLSGEKKEIKNISYNYEIMKYEVTNEQYVRFLNSINKDNYLKIDTIGVKGFYDGDNLNKMGDYIYLGLKSGKIKYNANQFNVEAGYENHPVGNVSWFGANAFALHYGLKLPNINEWEKAARGIQGYEYSYSDTLSERRANFAADSITVGESKKHNAIASKWKGTSPVGAYNGSTYLEGKLNTIDSPSPYGLYDMSGNVWEWISNEVKGSNSIAGGSYFGNFYSSKVWIFYQYTKNSTFPYIGFRCIRKN